MHEPQKERLEPPVEVPFDMLSQDALTAVIDDFILREGTDYGIVELSMDSKRERVFKLFQNEKIKLVYDPSEDSITIMTAEEYRRSRPQ